MTKKVLRALYVFFLLSFFLLSGCNSNNAPADIKTDFSADFSASYRNSEYTGKISSNRQGVANISITTPEEISGILFGYKSGELEISRESLICSADEAYLPQNSFPNLVKAILDGISQGRAKLSSQNESFCTYNFRTDCGECTLTADKDGKIKSAEIKSAEVKIDFSEIKIAE